MGYDGSTVCSSVLHPAVASGQPTDVPLIARVCSPHLDYNINHACLTRLLYDLLSLWVRTMPVITADLPVELFSWIVSYISTEDDSKDEKKRRQWGTEGRRGHSVILVTSHSPPGVPCLLLLG